MQIKIINPLDSMEKSEKLERALDLMRRLPPQSMGNNLKNIINLCPELIEELLSAVDQPLSVMRDDMKKEDFIICDYNRYLQQHLAPSIVNFSKLFKKKKYAFQQNCRMIY